MADMASVGKADRRKLFENMNSESDSEERKWKIDLRNIFCIPTDKPEKCLQFLNGFYVNASVKPFKEQILEFRKFSKILMNFLTNESMNTLMSCVIKWIFDKIKDRKSGTWFIKREILKCINAVLLSNSHNIIFIGRIVKDIPEDYLCDILASLRGYGDFDLQTTITETIFVLYHKRNISVSLMKVIPDSIEIRQKMVQIKKNTFTGDDCRQFLNAINRKQKNIFSLLCKNVRLNASMYVIPIDDENGIWVDFNLIQSGLSWYQCADNQIRELITLFASDVQTANLDQSDKNVFVITLKLEGQCFTSIVEKEDWANQIDTIDIIVAKSAQTSVLISKILPRVFGSKFKRVTGNVQKTFTITYKPLSIKIGKRFKHHEDNYESDSSSKMMNPLISSSTSLESGSCSSSSRKLYEIEDFEDLELEIASTDDPNKEYMPELDKIDSLESRNTAITIKQPADNTKNYEQTFRSQEGPLSSENKTRYFTINSHDVPSQNLSQSKEIRRENANDDQGLKSHGNENGRSLKSISQDIFYSCSNVKSAKDGQELSERNSSLYLNGSKSQNSQNIDKDQLKISTTIKSSLNFEEQVICTLDAISSSQSNNIGNILNPRRTFNAEDPIPLSHQLFNKNKLQCWTGAEMLPRGYVEDVSENDLVDKFTVSRENNCDEVEEMGVSERSYKCDPLKQINTFRIIEKDVNYRNESRSQAVSPISKAGTEHNKKSKYANKRQGIQENVYANKSDQENNEELSITGGSTNGIETIDLTNASKSNKKSCVEDQVLVISDNELEVEEIETFNLAVKTTNLASRKSQKEDDKAKKRESELSQYLQTGLNKLSCLNKIEGKEHSPHSLQLADPQSQTDVLCQVLKESLKEYNPKMDTVKINNTSSRGKSHQTGKPFQDKFFYESEKLTQKNDAENTKSSDDTTTEKSKKHFIKKGKNTELIDLSEEDDDDINKILTEKQKDNETSAVSKKKKVQPDYEMIQIVEERDEYEITNFTASPENQKDNGKSVMSKKKKIEPDLTASADNEKSMSKKKKVPPDYEKIEVVEERKDNEITNLASAAEQKYIKELVTTPRTPKEPERPSKHKKRKVKSDYNFVQAVEELQEDNEVNNIAMITDNQKENDKPSKRKKRKVQSDYDLIKVVEEDKDDNAVESLAVASNEKENFAEQKKHQKQSDYDFYQTVEGNDEENMLAMLTERPKENRKTSRHKKRHVQSDYDLIQVVEEKVDNVKNKPSTLTEKQKEIGKPAGKKEKKVVSDYDLIEVMEKEKNEDNKITKLTPSPEKLKDIKISAMSKKKKVQPDYEMMKEVEEREDEITNLTPSAEKLKDNEIYAVSKKKKVQPDLTASAEKEKGTEKSAKSRKKKVQPNYDMIEIVEDREDNKTANITASEEKQKNNEKSAISKKNNVQPDYEMIEEVKEKEDNEITNLTPSAEKEKGIEKSAKSRKKKVQPNYDMIEIVEDREDNKTANITASEEKQKNNEKSAISKKNNVQPDYEMIEEVKEKEDNEITNLTPSAEKEKGIEKSAKSRKKKVQPNYDMIEIVEDREDNKTANITASEEKQKNNEKSAISKKNNVQPDYEMIEEVKEKEDNEITNLTPSAEKEKGIEKSAKSRKKKVQPNYDMIEIVEDRENNKTANITASEEKQKNNEKSAISKKKNVQPDYEMIEEVEEKEDNEITNLTPSAEKEKGIEKSAKSRKKKVQPNYDMIEILEDREDNKTANITASEEKQKNNEKSAISKKKNVQPDYEMIEEVEEKEDNEITNLTPSAEKEKGIEKSAKSRKKKVQPNYDMIEILEDREDNKTANITASEEKQKNNEKSAISKKKNVQPHYEMIEEVEEKEDNEITKLTPSAEKLKDNETSVVSKKKKVQPDLTASVDKQEDNEKSAMSRKNKVQPDYEMFQIMEESDHNKTTKLTESEEKQKDNEKSATSKKNKVQPDFTASAEKQEDNERDFEIIQGVEESEDNGITNVAAPVEKRNENNKKSTAKQKRKNVKLVKEKESDEATTSAAENQKYIKELATTPRKQKESEKNKKRKLKSGYDFIQEEKEVQEDNEINNIATLPDNQRENDEPSKRKKRKVQSDYDLIQVMEEKDNEVNKLPVPRQEKKKGQADYLINPEDDIMVITNSTKTKKNHLSNEAVMEGNINKLDTKNDGTPNTNSPIIQKDISQSSEIKQNPNNDNEMIDTVIVKKKMSLGKKFKYFSSSEESNSPKPCLPKIDYNKIFDALKSSTTIRSTSSSDRSEKTKGGLSQKSDRTVDLNQMTRSQEIEMHKANECHKFFLNSTQKSPENIVVDKNIKRTKEKKKRETNEVDKDVAIINKDSCSPKKPSEIVDTPKPDTNKTTIRKYTRKDKPIKPETKKTPSIEQLVNDTVANDNTNVTTGPRRKKLYDVTMSPKINLEEEGDVTKKDVPDGYDVKEPIETKKTPPIEQSVNDTVTNDDTKVTTGRRRRKLYDVTMSPKINPDEEENVTTKDVPDVYDFKEPIETKKTPPIGQSVNGTVTNDDKNVSTGRRRRKLYDVTMSPKINLEEEENVTTKDVPDVYDFKEPIETKKTPPIEQSINDTVTNDDTKVTTGRRRRKLYDVTMSPKINLEEEENVTTKDVPDVYDFKEPIETKKTPPIEQSINDTVTNDDTKVTTGRRRRKLYDVTMSPKINLEEEENVTTKDVPDVYDFKEPIETKKTPPIGQSVNGTVTNDDKNVSTGRRRRKLYDVTMSPKINLEEEGDVTKKDVPDGYDVKEPIETKKTPPIEQSVNDTVTNDDTKVTTGRRRRKLYDVTMSPKINLEEEENVTTKDVPDVYDFKEPIETKKTPPIGQSVNGTVTNDDKNVSTGRRRRKLYDVTMSPKINLEEEGDVTKKDVPDGYDDKEPIETKKTPPIGQSVNDTVTNKNVSTGRRRKKLYDVTMSPKINLEEEGDVTKKDVPDGYDVKEPIETKKTPPIEQSVNDTVTNDDTKVTTGRRRRKLYDVTMSPKINRDEEADVTTKDVSDRYDEFVAKILSNPKKNRSSDVDVKENVTNQKENEDADKDSIPQKVTRSRKRLSTASSTPKATTKKSPRRKYIRKCKGKMENLSTGGEIQVEESTMVNGNDVTSNDLTTDQDRRNMYDVAIPTEIKFTGIKNIFDMCKFPTQKRSDDKDVQITSTRMKNENREKRQTNKDEAIYKKEKKIELSDRPKPDNEENPELKNTRNVENSAINSEHSVENIATETGQEVESIPMEVEDQIEDVSTTVPDKIEDVPTKVPDKIEDIPLIKPNNRFKKIHLKVQHKVENLPIKVEEEEENAPKKVKKLLSETGDKAKKLPNVTRDQIENTTIVIEDDTDEEMENIPTLLQTIPGPSVNNNNNMDRIRNISKEESNILNTLTNSLIENVRRRRLSESKSTIERSDITKRQRLSFDENTATASVRQVAGQLKQENDALKTKIHVLSNICIKAASRSICTALDHHTTFEERATTSRSPQNNNHDNRNALFPGVNNLKIYAFLNGAIMSVNFNDYLGKYLVMFFYPFDAGKLPIFCPPKEIKFFNDNLEKFQEINANVIGCSVDSVYTHRLYLKQMMRKHRSFGNVKFPLIGDPGHKICTLFDVMHPNKEHTYRAVIVFDPEGKIVTKTTMEVNLENILLPNIFKIIRLHSATRGTILHNFNN